MDQDGKIESVLVMEQVQVVRKEVAASAIPGFFLVFSGVTEDQVGIDQSGASI